MMIAAFLAGLMSLQDGVQENVDRLVRQLSSDDLEEREKAVNALVKFGKPALEALKTARDAAKDASVKAYLVDVVEE